MNDLSMNYIESMIGGYKLHLARWLWLWDDLLMTLEMIFLDWTIRIILVAVVLDSR